LRKGTCTLALILFLLVTPRCVLADTTWSLNDVTFSDGAKATGFFTLNSTLDGLTDWNIMVVGSTLTPTSANYQYSPPTSNFFYISPVKIEVASNPFAEFLLFVPDTPLTNAGGTVDLALSPESVDCEPEGPCGGLETGSLSTMVGVVPEPDSLFLVLSVLALFFLIFYLAKRQEHALREMSKSTKGDDFQATAR
jgi:hypothetical protein